LAWLYQHGEVVERQDDEDAVHVTVRLLPADRTRFEENLARDAADVATGSDARTVRDAWPDARSSPGAHCTPSARTGRAR